MQYFTFDGSSGYNDVFSDLKTIVLEAQCEADAFAHLFNNQKISVEGEIVGKLEVWVDETWGDNDDVLFTFYGVNGLCEGEKIEVTLGDIKSGTSRDSSLDQFDRFTVYFSNGVVDICREECGYLNEITIPRSEHEKRCFSLGTGGPYGDDDLYIFGVENDDVTGTNQANNINLGAGDDAADGEDGADIIDAGEGRDELKGGLGEDTLISRGGFDILDGEVGIDRYIVYPTHDYNHHLVDNKKQQCTQIVQVRDDETVVLRKNEETPDGEEDCEVEVDGW